MSEQPTKFCKDCANFKAPDLCYIGQKVNVVNGETFPEYMRCEVARSPGIFSDSAVHCGTEAVRFVANPAKAPAHRSSLGFILSHIWKRDSE